MTITDSYCNQKFWWLSVNLDNAQVQSCCSARPHKVSVDWLKDNSGCMFNTPELIRERQSMLQGEMVPSCYPVCYSAEQQGISSRRTNMGGQVRTHTSVQAQPEHMHIVLGNDCNMACAYCCKEYSSAWARDIVQNGPYPIDVSDGRYSLTMHDRIRAELSQKEIKGARHWELMLEEFNKLCQTPKVKIVDISGGEPFLYLELEKIVKSIPGNVKIRIWSGLGVDSTRLQKELDKIKTCTNVSLVLSAEATGELYNFLRNGNTWDRFNHNLGIIARQGILYEFNATMTNLSVFGIKDFVNWAAGANVMFSPCTDPDFLSVNVLDNTSKEYILTLGLNNIATQSIAVEPTREQVDNLRVFLLEFGARRKLSMDVFPDSFRHWLML